MSFIAKKYVADPNLFEQSTVVKMMKKKVDTVENWEVLKHDKEKKYLDYVVEYMIQRRTITTNPLYGQSPFNKVIKNEVLLPTMHWIHLETTNRLNKRGVGKRKQPTILVPDKGKVHIQIYYKHI